MSDPNPTLTGEAARLQREGIRLAVEKFELKGLLRELIAAVRNGVSIDDIGSVSAKADEIEAKLDAMK